MSEAVVQETRSQSQSTQTQLLKEYLRQMGYSEAEAALLAEELSKRGDDVASLVRKVAEAAKPLAELESAPPSVRAYLDTLLAQQLNNQGNGSSIAALLIIGRQISEAAEKLTQAALQLQQEQLARRLEEISASIRETLQRLADGRRADVTEILERAKRIAEALGYKPQQPAQLDEASARAYLESRGYVIIPPDQRLEDRARAILEARGYVVLSPDDYRRMVERMRMRLEEEYRERCGVSVELQKEGLQMIREIVREALPVVESVVQVMKQPGGKVCPLADDCGYYRQYLASVARLRVAVRRGMVQPQPQPQAQRGQASSQVSPQPQHQPQPKTEEAVVEQKNK